MKLDDFIFVCVGDSTVLFDSLGCVVGNILKNKKFPALVFGDIQNPITTKNIQQFIKVLKKEYSEKKIIIIDCTCSECLNKNFLQQNIMIRKGKVVIANINYECGDYNILCETFFFNNNKLVSINIKELLCVAYEIVNKIYETFNI